MHANFQEITLNSNDSRKGESNRNHPYRVFVCPSVCLSVLANSFWMVSPVEIE